MFDTHVKHCGPCGCGSNFLERREIKWAKAAQFIEKLGPDKILQC